MTLFPSCVFNGIYAKALPMDYLKLYNIYKASFISFVTFILSINSLSIFAQKVSEYQLNRRVEIIHKLVSDYQELVLKKYGQSIKLNVYLKDKTFQMTGGIDQYGSAPM